MLKPVLFALLAVLPHTLHAQTSPPRAVQTHAPSFDMQAGQALAAMSKRAGELKIEGVALVAYFEGDTVQSWTSKMIVVGTMKHPQTASEKGDNLLAVAYAKAAEMADTLKDSGSNVRRPMTGEFGWQGGVIARTNTGYVIAAFSGGKSEDDVAVSRAGLAVLSGPSQAR